MSRYTITPAQFEQLSDVKIPLSAIIGVGTHVAAIAQCYRDGDITTVEKLRQTYERDTHTVLLHETNLVIHDAPFNGSYSELYKTEIGEFYAELPFMALLEMDKVLSSGQYAVTHKDDLSALIQGYNNRYTECPPKAISQARFNDMLETLPPQRWCNIAGFEVFHMSELLTGDVAMWFASSRDNGACFEFNLSKDASDEQLREVLAQCKV